MLHDRRLDLVASILSDTGWSEHPDYRASQIFTRTLQIQAGGIDHAGRVFLATALHARYGGTPEDPLLVPTAPILRPGQAQRDPRPGSGAPAGLHADRWRAGSASPDGVVGGASARLVLHIGAIGALASGRGGGAAAGGAGSIARVADTRIEGLAEAAE